MKDDALEVLFEAMITGDTSQAIINQEKRGQADLSNSAKLPKGCPREKLELLGFVFGPEIDDLFVSVEMPDGWQIRPTDHHMWSELVDDTQVVRATIFYKAAFYDRVAEFYMKSD